MEELCVAFASLYAARYSFHIWKECLEIQQIPWSA